jgi:hypothetical protein
MVILDLLDRYRLARSLCRDRSTLAHDVARCLRGEPHPRQHEILGLVARLDVLETAAERLEGLDWYRRRLATIIYLYRQGLSCAEIAARLSPLSTEYGVRRTIELVAEAIADALEGERRGSNSRWGEGLAR